MPTLPTPVNGLCTACGKADFILSQDIVEVSPCVWNGEEWATSYTNEEESTADDAIRFYCQACGTHHVVPEDLP